MSNNNDNLNKLYEKLYIYFQRYLYLKNIHIILENDLSIKYLNKVMLVIKKYRNYFNAFNFIS